VWEFSALPEPGSKPAGSYARAFGAKKGLNDRAKERGLVELSDAVVWWWLMPDVQQTGESREGRRSRTGDYKMLDRGFVAAMHDGEMYDTLEGDACKHRHYQFGIIWQSVRQNVGLVVEPRANLKGHRAAPDTSRRTLIYPGGEELPWARWGEEFARIMPDPIRAELRRATPESSIDQQKLTEKLRSFQNRMNFFAVKPSTGGDAPGGIDITGGNPSGPGTRPKRRRKSGGDGGPLGREYKSQGDLPNTGKLISPKRDIPAPVWISQEEHNFKERAASYIPSENKIFINRDFQAFQECFDYWTKTYAPTPESAKKVRDVVEEVFASELISKVFHAMAFEGRAVWRDQFNFDTPPMRGLLSDEALTLAALGIVNTHHVIATRLGSIFGAAPKGEAPER
jgi:hypothetical protein